MTATPQHMTALAGANRVRLRQAGRRRVLAALSLDDGRRMVAHLLADPPEDVARMRVGYLLASMHRCSERLAVKHLVLARLPTRALQWRVGPVPANCGRALAVGQRQRLAAVLCEAADRQRSTAREPVA